MRGRKTRGTRSDYLSDALAVLGGWTQDGVQLKRVLACDESQHAALTERIAETWSHYVQQARAHKAGRFPMVEVG